MNKILHHCLKDYESGWATFFWSYDGNNNTSKWDWPRGIKKVHVILYYKEDQTAREFIFNGIGNCMRIINHYDCTQPMPNTRNDEDYIKWYHNCCRCRKKYFNYEFELDEVYTSNYH